MSSPLANSPDAESKDRGALLDSSEHELDGAPLCDLTSGDSKPPGTTSRLITKGRVAAVCGLLVIGLIVWGAVRIIQRSGEEQPIDPSLTQALQIEEIEGAQDHDDSTDGQISDDAPLVVSFLSENPISEAEHPLDPLLAIADMSLARLRSRIYDYQATIVKRERIYGRLQPETYIECKIRQPWPPVGQPTEDASRDPAAFAVYLRFLKPGSVQGREVIWVDGRNDNELLAHEGGLKNLLTLSLPPEGRLAMVGNRYPITQIGIEKLLIRLLEIGGDIRERGDCNIQINHNLAVNGRPCTRIDIEHTERRDDQEFYRAEIFIDHEHTIPIRYSAYDWPDESGGDAPLLETYTYTDLKLNVGLQPIDFDPANPAYRFK